MFVVHRRQQGMPNMKFRMHRCGLHYYDPRGKAFTFINTVSGNKEGFTNRQIKNADTGKTLYATLGYQSYKDSRWVVQSKQFKDCPVTVQDVDTSIKRWGKNIAALKGKTIRTTPNPVTEDLLKVPRDALNLHKEVFLSIDVVFVNKIDFLLTLSKNICFTAVNHLTDRTVPQLFEAFKDI
jgi:Holliday junction resolvase RusA-like endonuclease